MVGLLLFLGLVIGRVWWARRPSLLSCVAFWVCSLSWPPWSLLDWTRSSTTFIEHFMLVAFWTAWTGAALNAAVTIRNGGVMPVVGRRGARHRVWVSASKKKHHWLWLADRHTWFGCSVGDAFVLGGGLLLLIGAWFL